MRMGIDGRLALAMGWALVVGAVFNAAAPPAQAVVNALRIEDYATMPMTGSTAFPSSTANSAYLARVNFMRDDPANPNRFVVNDLNGQLYFLDKTTRSFTEYLNLNGRGSEPGLYDRLWTEAGFAGGFVTFQFDPDYVNNGKFYTVHVERTPSPAGSELPDKTNYPNLDLSNYGVTSSVDAPGGNTYRNVLVEWTDTDVTNTTFEGSARELLRIDARDRIHPIGDIVFNPLAGPEDDDWRMMYIAIGDAGNGEQTGSGNTDVRRTPQLLNTFGGKIIRIAPDANVNIPTTLSPNGKYRIPTDNPFTGVADPGGTNGSVRDEIWALGLRNPHRLAWDVDPQSPDPESSLRLIVNDIGLHTWEEVNFIYKGANYGYSQREGNQSLTIGTSQVIGPIPNPDTIPNQLICTGSSFSSCSSNGTVTPLYPVIQYGHGLAGQDPLIAGDSISSGFVYRGTQIPQLYGKYLFGDITTGAIYYADYDEMLAADDGDPTTLAEIHSIDILWDDPNDAPDDGEELYSTLFLEDPDAILGPMHQIVRAGYVARGGQDPNLPGGAAVTGPYGRADIRIAMDSSGELYILSKSDGMIRAIVGPEPIPGDYNYDGVVDAGDYQTWKAAYGSGVLTGLPYAGWGPDGNGDGRVDGGDYVYWRNRLPGDPEGGGGLVPEPASAVLAMLALFGYLIARRRAWLAG